MTEQTATSIRGKKIILRPFRLEDADPMWDSIDNEEVNKLTGTHDDFTREQIDGYIKKQVAADDESRVAFIIALPDDSRALGEVVINEIDRDNNAASIRIALFENRDFGQGYGTEAMKLMVNHGFTVLNLHRIELTVYAFNPRAIRAYEKAGFTKEGVMREMLHWDGNYIDGIIMSVLAHEWQALS
ncbi:MAG: GNAT family N-acetyltransferase [Aggregatilineales bacterium]